MSTPGGMPGHIAVDLEVLARAARDLNDASRDVSQASTLAGANPIDLQAFGAINTPLALTARHLGDAATEVLALLAASTRALSEAATDVVAQWSEYEDSTASSLDKAAVDLEGGRALR